MSKLQFSKQELAFFEEGDTLADRPCAIEDFSDLDEGERVDSWVDRALALLPIVGPARSQS
jgi:hypothetical protein